MRNVETMSKNRGLQLGKPKPTQSWNLVRDVKSKTKGSSSGFSSTRET